MPDPETPPIVGNEPGAPETPPETPPVESPTLPPETPPAEEPPPEMSPEEKRDHDMRSWIGRRDAELRTEMEKRNQALLVEIQKVGTVPATATEAPDPALDADAWFEHKLTQRVTSEQAFNEKLIRAGTAIVQQDELIKADPKLADEIYQEIQSGRVPIMRTMAPELAADIAITKAKSNILTRRMTTKPNPLADNKPVTVPVGGITPPPAPPAPVTKLPGMSDLAKATAKRYGMTDEEVAKVLA